MKLPIELWDEEIEQARVRELVELFANDPVVLTDKLANTVYLSPAAENLFGETAEALVNRLVYSVLGFGEGHDVPAGLEKALAGEGGPWKGLVRLPDETGAGIRLLMASAIVRNGRLLCGVLRLSREEAKKQ